MFYYITVICIITQKMGIKMFEKKEKDLEMGVGRSPAFGVFKDKESDWFFRRTLEFMNEKAAEIGECLAVARSIDESDGESWIGEWSQMASRVEKQGDASLAMGQKISARESFLRASNYYRAAEYGTPPSHTRFHEIWRKGVESMHKACPLFNVPIQIVEVDFDGKKLPGYYWRPDESNDSHPTLMVAGGNDSSLEELIYWVGMAAVRRGYNFFAFDHPGHRGAVHLYPDCVKRHDYEVPYKVAIDHLETLPGVDERIALTGYSFGGYVASRVAIYEDRLSAVIPNSPLIDFHKLGKSMFSDISRKIPNSVLKTLLKKRLKKKPVMKAFLEYTIWAQGYGTSLFDFIVNEEMREKNRNNKDVYTIVDDISKIECPALALVSEGEGKELVRQARDFIDGISSTKKEVYVFTKENDGCDDHCQLDNRSRSYQVMFDWLNEVLDYRYDRYALV